MNAAGVEWRGGRRRQRCRQLNGRVRHRSYLRPHGEWFVGPTGELISVILSSGNDVVHTID